VTAAPGDLWQAKARKLVDEAVYHLWTPTGYPMLDFLSQRRVLIDAIICGFSLGLIALSRWEGPKAWGMDEILKDNSEPKNLDPQVGHQVVDECHRAPSMTFTEAVSAFDCRYMAGLSATPWRQDGLSRLIYWHLGEKVHQVDATALVEGGHMCSRRW
jgi:hypothetical protein